MSEPMREYITEPKGDVTRGCSSTSQEVDMVAFALRWGATAILLLSVGLISFNVYPLGVYVGMLAQLLWTLSGICDKNNAIVVSNVCLLVISAIGLLLH